MKTTIKCDQPGCTYTRQVNPDYAKQTLGRHKLFTHGISGVSSAAKARAAKKSRKSEVETPAAEEQPKRRKYTKRAVTAPAVNFCPGCGCDLHAVAVAMTLRR